MKITKKQRFVDEEKCNGCGECWNSCPAVRIPLKRHVTIGGRVTGKTNE